MVIWLIGLSASGKSTIGKRLFEVLKPTHRHLVFLDGDDVRRVMGNDLGHTIEDRRKNADRICRLCEYLSSQEIHVICSILSIFPESRSWNRKNLKDYFEIYIKVSLERLRERETKSIYRRYFCGEITGVAGLDIPFPEPASPDMVIENERNLSSIDPLVHKILKELDEKGWLEVSRTETLKYF